MPASEKRPTCSHHVACLILRIPTMLLRPAHSVLHDQIEQWVKCRSSGGLTCAYPDSVQLSFSGMYCFFSRLYRSDCHHSMAGRLLFRMWVHLSPALSGNGTKWYQSAPDYAWLPSRYSLSEQWASSVSRPNIHRLIARRMERAPTLRFARAVTQKRVQAQPFTARWR